MSESIYDGLVSERFLNRRFLKSAEREDGPLPQYAVHANSQRHACSLSAGSTHRRFRQR